MHSIYLVRSSLFTVNFKLFSVLKDIFRIREFPWINTARHPATLQVTDIHDHDFTRKSVPVLREGGIFACIQYILLSSTDT